RRCTSMREPVPNDDASRNNGRVPRTPIHDDNPTLTSALSYVAHGWPVFPCHSMADGQCTCGDAECGSPGKHPMVPSGYLDATLDETIVHRWWTHRPDANVAYPTGAITGFDVLDIDPRHDGFRSLEILQARIGPVLNPTTLAVRTGGGGLHLYFAHADHVTNTTKLDGLDGIDVRGQGGYVIAPPSLHESGQRYLWTVPRTTSIVPWPDPLLAIVRGTGSNHGGHGQAGAAPGKLHQGARNSGMISLAGTMRRRGFSEPAILAALLVENQTRCVPPLPESEIAGIAHSACRYDPAATPTPVLRRFSEIQAKPVEWLWLHRIALGKLTLLVGDPGEGKSLTTIDFIAHITTGRAWPDGAPCPRADCITLNAEDDEEDTTKPRLMAAEADVHRVTNLQGVQDKDGERLVNLVRDLGVLRATITQTSAVLVSIDPLNSYLPVKASWKDTDVKQVLTPIATLAKETRAAIVAVMHLNKAKDAAALYRVIGSIGYVATARGVLGVIQHPDYPTRRVLTHVKTNFKVALGGHGGGSSRARVIPRPSWSGLCALGAPLDTTRHRTARSRSRPGRSPLDPKNRRRGRLPPKVVKH